MGEELTLMALLRFGYDAASVAKTQAAAKSIEQQFDKTIESIRAKQKTVRQTEQLAYQALFAGGMLTAGITASADHYIKSAGAARSITADWTASTKQLEEANLRVGKVAAQAVLPVLKISAQLAEQVATFAEKNPELVKAVFVVGTVVAAIGTLASVATRGIRIYLDAKEIIALQMQQRAADTQAAAARDQLAAAGTQAGAGKAAGAAGGSGLLGRILGIAGAALGGIELGKGVYNAIKPAGADDADKIFAKAAANISYNLTMVTQGADKANKAFIDTARLYGLVEDTADDANASMQDLAAEFGSAALFFLDEQRKLAVQAQLLKQQGGLGIVAGFAVSGASAAFGAAASASAQKDPALAAYIAFRKDQAAADADYTAKVREISTDSIRQQLDALRDFGQQTVKVRADHARAEATVLRDFGRQQIEQAETFKRDEIQIEADRQREITQSRRQFETGEARTEADWQRGRQRNVEDFERQRAATEIERARQRAKSWGDFIRSELQTEADYYASRASQAEKYGLESARAEAAHALQMARLREDFMDSLGDLQESRDAEGLIKARREYLKQSERAEQDYQIGAGQRNEDWAVQLVEQQQAFEDQRAARLAEYQRRLDDQTAEDAYQDALQKAEWERQRAVDQAEHEREVTQRAADFEADLVAQAAEAERLRQARLSDFDRQRIDQLDQFKLARSDRQAEFERTEAERAQQLLAEIQRIKTDGETRRAELDTQAAAERTQREAEFHDRLNEIDENLTGEKGKRQAYYDLMLSDFETYLKNMRGAVQTAAVTIGADFTTAFETSFDPQPVVDQVVGAANTILNSLAGIFNGRGQLPIDINPGTPNVPGTPGSWPIDINPPLPGFAAGGYLGRGMFRGGERGREFVLNHDTTRAAESALGQLSQDAILAGLNGGGQRARTTAQLTLNQNFTFTGSLTDAERQWFKSTARDEAYTAFDQVLEASG